MGIRRLFGRQARSDIHVPEIEERWLALASATPASRIDLDTDRYRHLRKTGPVNRASSRTLTWFSALPDDVQPLALLRRYPRIANLIVAVWADRKCFGTYMESLLTDQRGGRRGFPPDVIEDLVSLRRYHANLDRSPLRSGRVGRRA